MIRWQRKKYIAKQDENEEQQPEISSFLVSVKLKCFKIEVGM
jgi:hypothetical protein